MPERSPPRRRAVPAAARLALLALATLGLAAGASCGSPQRTDGLDVRTLPLEVRADYEVFADRCSRCHSLARPLNSDFDSMDQWRNYVARMRRQPGSGISARDEATILGFLQYLTDQRRAAREARP